MIPAATVRAKGFCQHLWVAMTRPRRTPDTVLREWLIKQVRTFEHMLMNFIDSAVSPVALVKPDKFVEVEVRRAEPVVVRQRPDCHDLLKQLSTMPEAMRCKCGHPMNMHGQDPHQLRVRCWAKGCDCEVWVSEIEMAKQPTDPFVETPLVNQYEKLAKRELTPRDMILRYPPTMVRYPLHGLIDDIIEPPATAEERAETKGDNDET